MPELTHANNKSKTRKKPQFNAKRQRALPKAQRYPTKRKTGISGSITTAEKVKKRIPWIFGNKLRKPKINFPKIQRQRLSMPMPSKALGLIIVWTILFVLQTGVVYLVYMDYSVNLPAVGADLQGEPIFIYPGIQNAFIIESIVASILIFICSMGFLFLYQASKFIYNRKMALRLLIMGLILIMVSFIALQYMLSQKLPDPVKKTRS